MTANEELAYELLAVAAGIVLGLLISWILIKIALNDKKKRERTKE